MDTTLLQLFTAEEILARLSSCQSTGAVHAFTTKESANIYFQDGLIVGAVKGLLEGEEVVKQVLDWEKARFIWQLDVTPVAPLAKPMKLDFAEFLNRLKAPMAVQIGGKTLSGAMPKVGPPPAEPKRPTVALPLPPRADKTGPIDPPPPPKFGSIGGPNVLTATKHMDAGQETRVSHEEALLKKHPLALVSDDPEMPRAPLRLTQLSILIGRNPACDFHLDHTSVSRQHCLLQITDRGLHVKDLGTTNGTKVNGIVLTEGYINVGDTLSMGKLSFILEKDESGVRS